MKLLLLAGLLYTSFGMQCIAKQDKNKTKCEAISVQGSCSADTDCEYVDCDDNRNGNLCKKDNTCYWTGKACVSDSGCGAAPTKAQCNLKTDSDGGPCGFNTDSNTCEARTCAHSGKSLAWCLKYNDSAAGPKCMFLSQQCWNLPSGEEAKTATPQAMPNKKTKGSSHCTSTKASKRVKCMLKDEGSCTSVAEDQCVWEDGESGSGSGSVSACDVSGSPAVMEKKCNRKKMCKWSSPACTAKVCADFSKNQFTCHFKAMKRINLPCVMDGTTCRSGFFADADMIAKACSVNTMQRVCHAQVKADGSPRCEWNNDDGICRDAENKTCADSNRKECRALKNASPGQGCWWLGPDLRCLDSTTADCTILPKERCKKVKKFKAHFGLTCALNRSNNRCYNNQVTCGDVTQGNYCVEHINCSWNGTLCVEYNSFPIAEDSNDTCQTFTKKTCKTWENNCFWTKGAKNGSGLCHVQPGATMP